MPRIICNCGLSSQRLQFRMCVSQDDPLLTNAGKWFAWCHACKKYEWVPSLVNGGELLQHDNAFSLLIAGQLSLVAVLRSAKQLAASAESQSMLPSPPNTPWKKKPLPVPIASSSSQSRKRTTQPTNLSAPVTHASEITPFQECSAPSAWIHLVFWFKESTTSPKPVSVARSIMDYFQLNDHKLILDSPEMGIRQVE
ncbi:hypothetical protein P691DRAFT_768317 [Macrolepiota fuliginosa MF-IS2]|uniref:Uncharacterized protein n=1 Tax=Macrolepiota fuliginosa MF-IS2 TaxID=1400762 RepID=A0A9P6BVS0_9AGAR|nr:hypothetical protein P691DRAFT_768317 [Macrolepiota fuliginosa MF-IS2]